MAKQLFGYASGYGPTYGGSALPPSYAAGVVGVDPYVPEGSILGSSSQFSGAEAHSMGKYGGVGAGGAPMSSFPSQYGVMESSLLPGVKRPSEALYHQSLLGNHNSIGPNEALFSTNPLLKRPRFETGSHLPIYPQRPGQKDCAYYMLTRTCKFGDTCKFDHPLWVPEGGIPDWKEVPMGGDAETLPERPGEQDCPYFIKTQKCKYGQRCKFNHPKDKQVSEAPDTGALPERPTEPICAYYSKTGKCKFGASCVFHHPKDIQLPSSVEVTKNAVNGAKAEYAVENSVSYPPALFYNSKGLPIRPGEQDCPFYVKTGSCKYGATCRFNHPERNVFKPLAAPPYLRSPAASLSSGILSPVPSHLPNFDARFSQTSQLGLGPILYSQRPGQMVYDAGHGPIFYPQRPGQKECDYFMKTGHCKFGETCRFHHPVKLSDPSPKLTPAGLPRRMGAVPCPYYMKTGTCKFGPTCKFDHPPPAEAIAMAAKEPSTPDDKKSPKDQPQS